MDQVDANALMVAAIRFPLELRICQSILQFPNLRFLRELQMCSIILEMKFAYAAAFLYAFFATWRENTFLTNESSAAQTNYQYGYALLMTHRHDN
jgi:hypothetical protein